MLENYHRMVRADHHLAVKLPEEESAGERAPQTWQIHIHQPGDLPEDEPETTVPDDQAEERG